MPTEIVFPSGAAVKVIAAYDAVAAAVVEQSTIETERFAGFRGAQAVGGERIAINGATVAYAIDVPTP